MSRVGRFSFASAGEGVEIFEPVAILRPERITLRNHIIISEFCYLAGGLGVHIGNFVHLAAHSSISGGGCFIIEDFSGLSAGARVITGTDDFLGQGIPAPAIPAAINHKYRKVTRSLVHLKRHSLLGTNVVVFPGVTIGEGAVVGAGSVVTRDLEPWGVYLGAPARRVKDRPPTRVVSLGERVYEETGVVPEDLGDIAMAMRRTLAREAAGGQGGGE